MLHVNKVSDIRELFLELKESKQYIIDKTGCKMLEVCGVNFKADEPSIFGNINYDYVAREISWYEMQSLNVNDIPPPVPAIWRAVATPDGYINSNYGWAIDSAANYNQYTHCWRTLKKDPFSRRAVMIYTRPKMQHDYNADGMSDFMCTNVVQYMIRQGALHAIVQMRSNDVVFGYKNDYAWQKHVLDRLAHDLMIEPGEIMWQVGSLHVYERHFDLVK